MAALLRLSGVCKSYGALKVTDGIDLSVAEGETLGILGPNGAGKTSLFNLISGDVSLDAGRIEYEGQEVSRLAPHQRCRAGIGRSYQVPQPFGAMSVFENLVTAACFGGKQREQEAWDTAYEVLLQTGLLAQANKPAGSLRLLDRKRLELARALATQPRLLLLDEVLAGLNPQEIAEMMPVVRGIADSGVTVLMIEHVMQAVMHLAEHVWVLAQGRLIAEGSPAEVTADERVVEAYLGHGTAARLRQAAGAAA